MDDMQLEIGKKIRAAQELGLEVVQTYQMISGKFFIILEIRKGEVLVNSYPKERPKAAVLAGIDASIAGLQSRISELQTERTKIEKVKDGE